METNQPGANRIAYNNFPAEGEEYPRHFVNVEALEAVPTGVYGEDRSLMFGFGYGYIPQMPYGPYSSVTAPSPSGGDCQFYYSQSFPSTSSYFQQSSSSNMPYLHATFPMSQADQTRPVMQDWVESSEMTVSLILLPSPAASPEPIGPVRSFVQSIRSSSAVVSQQQTPFYAFGSLINSYDQGYFLGEKYQHGSNFEESSHRMINDGRSFIATDLNRRQGKGNASIHNFNDHPIKQNRGPRYRRPTNAASEQGSLDRKDCNSTGIDHKLYNRPDFSIHYKDAKFFIIKSYNEDNVHKSIKYGVWASTANGNKKLDIAYHEAMVKGESCPVFLFFSVNTSALFCGMAEMIGPVDFDKNVDYWQQDKWSGQFPVKWHIIKDIPSNMFRHIILECNDNRPVTHSRDTQEVNLENGLEMLGIFKKYEAHMSILDDFGFYEAQQNDLQGSKPRQWQLQEQHVQFRQPNTSNTISLGTADVQHNPALMSSELVGQISRNFAQAVRLGRIDNDCVPSSANLSEETSDLGDDSK